MSKRHDRNLVTSALSFALIAVIAVTAIATLLPPTSLIRTTAVKFLTQISSAFGGK